MTFERLLELYHHVAFDAEGDEGVLTIASPDLLSDILEIEADDRVAADTGVAPLVDRSKLVLGASVRVQLGRPRLALGVLARTWDDFLLSPGARFKEPKRFFVVEGRVDGAVAPVPAQLAAYRLILKVVARLGEAAAYIDEQREEIVYFDERKIVLPIRFKVADAARMNAADAEALLGQFRDDLHSDQKLGILADAVIRLIIVQPVDERFGYLLRNLDALNAALVDGYRLYASSFSYAKIRGELEAAQLEYMSKIHKTLIDIQNQLLGIPVATIVVASQLKDAKGCGVEFWTNSGVLAGAWTFVILLLLAIINQWHTLSAISRDIGAQKERLERDFRDVSSAFADIFTRLNRRIIWQHMVLFVVAAVAVIGATFASYAFVRLTQEPFVTCLAASPDASALLAKHEPSQAVPAAPPEKVTLGHPKQNASGSAAEL